MYFITIKRNRQGQKEDGKRAKEQFQHINNSYKSGRH